MKTKIIPFDLDTAKKIQAGEIEGRIVTTVGGAARIVCFDKKTNTRHPLVVLIHDLRDPDIESVGCYTTKGEVVGDEIYDLCIELPEEATEEQHPIEESELYQAGYKVGFEAGRCVAFDEKKGCVIKEAPKYDDVEEVPTGDGSIVFLRHKKHEFRSFDKVLVREGNHQVWMPRFYSFKGINGNSYMTDGECYEQVIKYEGNESLVGTTDKPKED